MRNSKDDKKIAKPFLKWAGGKTQLIKSIEKKIPQNLNTDKFIYVEPFVGSGAVLFWILEKYSNIEKAVINDINIDLTDTFQTIKDNVDELIAVLQKFENEYHELSDNLEAKQEYYYSKRLLFNKRKNNRVTQSALFIFLNKTCFNGLYRVNKKNEFNVPIGSYKSPTICDSGNLELVSKSLQKVEILNCDYSETLSYAAANTLYYLDPPYKPLNKTSSFNSYAKNGFYDREQKELAEFCKELDILGADWILSNSDVKSVNPQDNFFDDLYSKFKINRVKARRSINSNASRRGDLNELLITNNG